MLARQDSGGLVEHQHVRVGQDAPSNPNGLPLHQREIAPALAYAERLGLGAGEEK